MPDGGIDRGGGVTGYFAFVRRDADHRYHATLPDFPGCAAEAARLDVLEAAIREAMRACVDGGDWPVPTRLEQLPREHEDHDGYWLMVDVTPQA